MKFKKRRLIRIVCSYDDGSVEQPELFPHTELHVPETGQWFGVSKNGTFSVCHEVELAAYREAGWSIRGHFIASEAGGEA